MNKAQLHAVFEVLTTLHKAIQSTGEQGIPSGHLYAMLMGKIGLSQYEQLISILLQSGKVTRSNHLLRAVS